jgi:hypothetical protein
LFFKVLFFDLLLFLNYYTENYEISETQFILALKLKSEYFGDKNSETIECVRNVALL